MLVTDITYDNKKNKFIVKIDAEKYTLDYSDFEKFNIKKDMIVSQELLDEINKISTFENAYNIGLNFISYKIRTTYEVRNKLMTKNFDPEIIARVIEKLEKLNLLDDYKYCKIFINEKLNFTDYSKRRVANDLFKKGISKDIYRDYLEESYDYEIEYEKANNLVDKKINSWSKKYTDYKLKNKIVSFLAQKGFPYDISTEIAGKY